MSACEFSDGLVSLSSQFSPSGSYLAIIAGCRLTIRDAQSLELFQIFALIDKADKVEFSPDSLYIACSFFSRSAVQCFSIMDPEWKCRINEGVAGLVNTLWAPDSRNIITFSDFGVQLSMWSLTDNTSHIIAHPKPSSTNTSGGSQQQLSTFSDDSRYWAIVHRVELRDYIGQVLNLSNYSCILDQSFIILLNNINLQIAEAFI
jgi:hypothetical protein